MKPRVLVAIESDRVLPNWAITHYLQQTEVNYLRLVTTQEICAYAARGHDLGRLVAATESAEIFPRERISLAAFKGRVALGESPETVERFWKIVSRHARPMVFVAAGDSDACLPLYDYLEAEALVVRRLETHSPFNASLEGMASALPDLIYAREREQRARDAWRNEQIGQAARNIRDIASASEIINGADTPAGLQAYASHMLGQLLENQQRLNEAAGITVRRIDQVV